jgi:serine/threonine protein kinase/WD40 repeat protein/tetratricopeptide (TPR) repeat protein
MNLIEDRARLVFLAAVERASDLWPAFLDEACAGDSELRARVEQLLHAHQAMGSIRGGAPNALVTTSDVAGAEGPGTVIGPYKLLEQIGEGGFGVVFLAEQSQPVRRKVALKVLKPGMDTRRVVARFEAERQALAIMDHPNIAKVLDGGATTSGRPYFVMELVKGAPITEFCDTNQLTPRQRLELFIPVCQAVQHAHQKGIIHRDLKPSNILVSRHDTTPIVKVIDFGVAKALGQSLTDKTLFTGIAQMIGTPLYMSPEQAGMSDLDVDTRSDIYSLGVLLYELLTGTTPFTRERFQKAAFGEMQRIIREEDPPRPSTRISTLGQAGTSVSARRQTDPRRLSQLYRGELDWIVMKCLEKDRNRRYETASAFAADVQHYLKDEPVLACPPSAGYRLRKLLHRNKKLLGTAAAFVLVLVIGAALSIWQAVRATRSEAIAHDESRAADLARKEAQAAATRAQTANADNRRIVARQYVANGSRLLEQGNRTDALVWFVEALRKDAADADRAAMHRLRIAATAQLCPRPEQIWFHSGPVTEALFSPDGRRVLTVSGSEARLWNVADGRPTCPPMNHLGEIKHIAFSADGRRLLTVAVEKAGSSVGFAREARVWDAASGQQLTPALKHDGYGWPTFSPDGQRLLTVSGVRSESYKDPARPAVTSVRKGGEVRITETATGKPIAAGLTLPDGVGEAHFSPDGSRLFAKNLFGQARLWDTTAGQPVTDVLTHGDPEPWSIHADGFSPDGKELSIVYASDSSLHPSRGIELQVAARGWSAASGQPLGEARKLDIHLTSGYIVLYATDGRRILVAPSGTPGRLFDAHTGKPIGRPLPLDKGMGVMGSSYPIRLSPFCPDGKRVLLTYSPVNFVYDQSRGEARLWDASTAESLSPPMMLSAPADQFAFSADGARLLLVEGGKSARVWDASTGRPLTPPVRHEGQTMRAALSANGAYLLTAAGNEARIWEASSGRPITPLLVHNGAVTAAWFNPEATHVLTASGDGTVRLWPLTAGSPPTRALEHDSPVQMAAFNSDGRTVLTTTELSSASRLPSVVRLWDVSTGKQLWPPLPSTDWTQTVQPDKGQVSPDGRWLAVWRDKDVHLYDIMSGQMSGAPLPHEAAVSRVQFTPDSQGLFTLQQRLLPDRSWEIVARVWDLAKRQTRHEPVRFSQRPSEVRFSPDGASVLLLSAAPKKQAQLLDSHTGKPIVPLMEILGSPVFSPDSRWLAALTPNQTIQVLDAKTGQPSGPPLAQNGTEATLRFFADSRTLLAVSSLAGNGRSPDDRWTETRRWDVAAGQLVGPVVKHRDVGGMLSPDLQFACTNEGTDVHIFDLTTGLRTAPPLKHPAHVDSVRFSPDRRVLMTINGATIVESHTLYFYDAYGVHSTAVNRALGEVRLWDARTGELVVPPLSHLARSFLPSATEPGISEDGRHLLLSNDMSTLEVWDLPDPDPRSEDELVQLAQAVSGRRFDETGGPQPLGADQWAQVRARLPDAVNVQVFDHASWHRREAIRSMGGKDWYAATGHLDSLIAARPNEWRAFYMRARCRFELGDPKASVADNTRAIELGADDFRCWNNRALSHFRLENWQEAAADCEKVLARFPESDNTSLASQLIHCRARLGDAAGYRRACTGFIQRWEKRVNPNDLAWPCVLAPDALADLGQVVQLAEKACRQSPTAANRNTLGAALYRAGKWEEAVETLDQNQGASAAFDWLFLAMAHQRLGHADKAKEFLEKAVAWLESARRNKAVIPSLGQPPREDQQVELATLHDEAQRLVNGAKSDRKK